MDSTKEDYHNNNNNNDNNHSLDDCVNLSGDQIFNISDQEEDLPFTEEEKSTVDELLNGKKIEEKRVLKNEYLECKRFYSKLKGINKYDLTEDNFKYWKGKAYVGTAYREFIQKSSKIMVCTALVNERVQINIFDKLIHQKKAGEISIDKGILKYVMKDNNNNKRNDFIIKSNIDYLRKGEEFLTWRFKSHLFRFGFIKKYLQDQYQLDYNEFRSYSNVEKYFDLLL